MDSNDRDRLEDLHHEVVRLLGEDELKEKPVLFFANKQDLPHALSPEEVAERLKLSAIRDRPWRMFLLLYKTHRHSFTCASAPTGANDVYYSSLFL